MGHSILDEALLSKKCLISVMGPHANESTDEIFTRKIDDIKKIGWTLWLIRSRGARVGVVQEFFTRWEPQFILFITPSTPNGAKQTSTEHLVRRYSNNYKNWEDLPQGMGKVTGSIDKLTCGLVIDELMYFGRNNLAFGDNNLNINLQQYFEYKNPGISIRFMQGNSMLCSIKATPSILVRGMLNINRKIVGVGRLRFPFSVWLQK